MSKTILITGGCGYIGSRVAEKISREDFSVVVADKVKPEDRGLKFSNKIECRIGDLRIPENCRKALEGIDLVLHLAANIGPLTYMHNHQAEIIQENFAIDAALYKAMIDNRNIQAVIYSSSSMVYQNAQKYPYTEEDISKIYPPTNVYGFSKLAGEYFCKSFYAQYGLPYVIIRYHDVYGPGEESKGNFPGDIHVIPALIEKVLSGQYPVKLLGNPNATRPFVYIDDAVEATIKIIKMITENNNQVINNNFNIGVKEAIKIISLAELIWSILGDGRPFDYTVEKTNAITAVRREVDPTKFVNATGWEPTISLKEGIIKTAEWVKNRKK